MHNLLESRMLHLLVSAFLSPAAQPCKAARGYGGRQVGNWDGTGGCPLLLHRICACPCHATGTCWLIHQRSADEQWEPVGAAAGSKEGMRNLGPHMPPVLL